VVLHLSPLKYDHKHLMGIRTYDSFPNRHEIQFLSVHKLKLIWMGIR